MPGFWGFFSFFLSRRDARVVGRCGWILGAGLVASFCPDLPGFSDSWTAAGGVRGATASRPWLRCIVWRMGWVSGWGCWLRASWCFFFKFKKLSRKVRDASRSDYVIPASRPSRKLQAVPGEGFSRAVLPHGYPARRWCTTALVALRGGCPLSRAVRRLAFAVTVSSVIRGGDEPRGELSVLARKRSGDRGDLSFPVVTGIG